MPVGLHPANEVRRVKHPGNREMRVRTPPWERSLRTVSRHSRRHGLRQKSRRMPEGLHRLVSARSRVRVPPGPSCGPVAQLVEQDVFPKPSSPQFEYSGGNAGQDYIRFGTKRSWPLPCPATEESWRMQMGIHRWRLRPAVRVRKFSSILVAGTDQTGECRSDYMVERLLRQEVGGSIPPLGNQVAQ